MRLTTIQRHTSPLLALSACLLAASLAAGENVDPYVGNLLVDGQLRLEQDGQRVYLKTPRYWTLNTGAKRLKGHDLPFDRQVKAVGDCSIRLDGAGSKVTFSRLGWWDTNRTMRHGWAYVASLRLKLAGVTGKVWAEVGYSWNRAKSREFSGTLDWTEVRLEFTLARGTNLLRDFSVHFEGAGTVWVDDLQLRMRDPQAFQWWEEWNGQPPTARLSEIAGTGEEAGVLPTVRMADLDRYGGIKSVRSAGTGFFRCEKLRGKWWLVTPEGHGFFKTAMFVPAFPSYQNYNEVLDKIGGRGAWAAQTYLRLRSWAFNSIEWGPGWALEAAQGTYGRAPKEIAGKRMAYTANARSELCTDPGRNGGVKVPVVDWGWQRFPDVFSDEFRQAVVNYSTPGRKRSHFKPRPDDPWLIGYILADEPPWYGPGVWYGSLTDGFHRLPNDAPGKKRWITSLRGKYGSIGRLNEAWSSGFASWDAFAAASALPRGKAAVEDRRAFMGLVAERWYSLVAAQVRKYDGNHLILGGNATRLYPAVFAAEAKVADVLCASLYFLSGVYRPHPDFGYYVNEQVHTWTDKPIMVGYMCGENDGGGLPGIRSTETAAQRGQAYVSYAREVAANSACVGLFWWMYQSWPEPNTEGYSKNWGIVTPDNRVYLDLLPYVQRANANVYAYRLGEAPEQPEPPTQWEPSHHWLLLSQDVTFRLSPLPYPVDRYEIEVTRADGRGKRAVLRAVPGEQCIEASQTLIPGRWQWRARSVLDGETSGWSQPFLFQVAARDEARAFERVNRHLADGSVWKHTVVQEPGGNVGVEFEPNADGEGNCAPVTLRIPQGSTVRRVELHCPLAEPLLLRQGIQCSFRAAMRADTEGGAAPTLTIGLNHGYRLTESYAPIDKGWLVQRALSENRITHVRTTLRPPKDVPVTDLSIRLGRCRGKVEIVSLELMPETEYETGTTLMDDYRAIVAEFRSRGSAK